MALRDVLADLSIRVRGLSQLTRANAQVDRSVGGLQGAIAAAQRVGTALTGAFAVREISRFTNELIDLGDEIGKTSQQIGVSATQLQAWRFVADRAGVDGRAMSQSFMRLQRAAYDASQGSRQQAAAFRELGVELRGADGELRSADDLMLQMTRGMAGLEDETQKVALAQVLMGRSGARLLPMLNGGEEGVRELLARFRELGGGLSEDFVESAEAAQDAITDWNAASMSAKSQLGAAFLPTLTRVINTLTRWSVSLGQVVEQSSVVEATIASLVVAGVALATTYGGAAASAALALAPFVLLFLVAEDFITLMKGGDSVIGRIMDTLGGDGTQEAFVRNMTEGWEGLVLWMERAADAWEILTGSSDNFGPDETRLEAFRRTFEGRASRADREEQRARLLEDGASARMRTAALQGQVVVSPGQTREAALEQANRIRAAEGMDAIRAPWEPPPSFNATAPLPSGGRREQSQRVEVQVNQAAPNVVIHGARDVEGTRRMVREELDRDRRRTGNEIADALLVEAPEEGD